MSKTKEKTIRTALDEQLTGENQLYYADLLNKRIQENRQSMAKLSITLVICYFAFPLIAEAKISEISWGPLKVDDIAVALRLIPSIFAFIFYKYITVWITLVEQKATYKILTSKIFSLKTGSYLNQRLWPYSFLDSIMFYHLEGQSKPLNWVTRLLWWPIGLIIILFPFVFQYYMLTILYEEFGFKTIVSQGIIVLPVIITLFTLLIIAQSGIRNLRN